jgi:hypothetical protein
MVSVIPKKKLAIYIYIYIKPDPLISRYDVLSLTNSRFGDFVDRIYPIGLEIKDIADTDRSVSYLDLHLTTESKWRLRTKLYDKRDHFNFPIVIFPFICSNIPAAPAYRVYISQLIRYSIPELVSKKDKRRTTVYKQDMVATVKLSK